MRLHKIGRYEVIRELGQGGMATVYHARDPRFQREVAVKVLPREFLHTKQLKARFERESQTVAALEHQAIVPVYDAGSADGQPFLVMRFMVGGSLSALLRQGPLSIQDSAHLLHRIGSALDFAHSEGVIHRDLKPANVLFDRFGEASLSDFGIAMLEEATLNLTKTGSIVGTPAYMSPEQVQGEEKLDATSDVYSMGIILFEMLTGQQPFSADTPTKLMMKHVLEPVPRIRDLDPGLPPGADDVIARAMAKDPRDRYPSAGELAEAARRLLGADRRGQAGTSPGHVGSGPAGRARRRPGRRRMSRTLLPEGAGWRGIGRFLPRGPWGKAAAAALILAGLVSAGILGAGAFRGSSPPLAAVLARSGSATASTTTSAPMPTATWTSIPSPTPSLAPSSTPSPSLSPTPSFVWVTISSNARCRFGPARSFATAAFLAVGELVRAYGQDPTGEWWWVELPDGSAFCWVSDALVGLPMPPSIGAGTPGSPEPASPSPAASLPATSSAQP